MTFNGVFATHQHQLFSPVLRLFCTPDDSPPLLRRTHTWRVSTRAIADEAVQANSTLAAFASATQEPVREPTFLVDAGVDMSSLAFQVAAEQVRHAPELQRA